MAEQLAFEERFGQRGAVHLDERAARGERILVQDVGDQFLARARLARDEDGGIGRRRAPDHLEDARHLRAGADDLVPQPLVGLGRGRVHLRFLLLRIEEGAHLLEDVLDVERLVQVIERAEHRRLDGDGGGREGGHHDDRHRLAARRLGDFPQRLQPRHVGHLHVHQHQCGMLWAVVDFQHLFAGGGFQRLVPLVGEQIDEQRAD